MDQDLTILSPEKTILTYRLAGLGSRIGAHILDLILIGAVFYAAAIGLSLIGTWTDRFLAQGLLMFLAAASPFLYFILLEGLWNGQTVGKKAFGVRVRMADGTPVTFMAAFCRNIMRPADIIPGPYLIGLVPTQGYVAVFAILGTYTVGLVAMFMNPRSQRIGDLIAGTVVCYEKRTEPRFALAPHSAGIHPLESSVGDLRGMTQEEYYALRRFCDRFPELSPETQTRFVADLWTPLAAKLNVPSLPNVHPIYLAEAVVMKYGREKGLL